MRKGLRYSRIDGFEGLRRDFDLGIVGFSCFFRDISSGLNYTPGLGLNRKFEILIWGLPGQGSPGDFETRIPNPVSV